jgi:hypothetical protein
MAPYLKKDLIQKFLNFVTYLLLTNVITFTPKIVIKIRSYKIWSKVTSFDFYIDINFYYSGMIITIFLFFY